MRREWQSRRAVEDALLECATLAHVGEADIRGFLPTLEDLDADLFNRGRKYNHHNPHPFEYPRRMHIIRYSRYAKTEHSNEFNPGMCYIAACSQFGTLCQLCYKVHWSFLMRSMDHVSRLMTERRIAADCGGVVPTICIDCQRAFSRVGRNLKTDDGVSEALCAVYRQKGFVERVKENAPIAATLRFHPRKPLGRDGDVYV
jgi:hypothetical protein